MYRVSGRESKAGTADAEQTKLVASYSKVFHHNWEKEKTKEEDILNHTHS